MFTLQDLFDEAAHNRFVHGQLQDWLRQHCGVDELGPYLLNIAVAICRENRRLRGELRKHVPEDEMVDLDSLLPECKDSSIYTPEPSRMTQDTGKLEKSPTPVVPPLAKPFVPSSHLPRG